MTKIGTIISFCTHDLRFLGRGIAEASCFSDQIVVAVADHFFDGTPENRSLLQTIYSLYPTVTFVEFAYNVKRLYIPHLSCAQEDPDWPRYWAATTRYVGFHALRPEIDTVLFLDSDEIPDGRRVRDWLLSYQGEEAVRFAGYFYGLLPSQRAKGVQELSLLCKRRAFEPDFILNRDERAGLFDSIRGRRKQLEMGLDGEPLFHHYSWTRTKEECLAKAKRWGHRKDADWESCIEAWFQAQTIYRTGYGQTLEYEQVVPFFDPFGNKHVQTIDAHSLFLASLG